MSVSSSDIKNLKSIVDALEKTIKDLKNKPSSSDSTSSINYTELANTITEIDIYKDKLVKEIGKKPDKLADKLGDSLSSNENTIQKIWQGLATNTQFAESIAKRVTNPSTIYPSALKGSQGEAGSLGSSKDAIKNSLFSSNYTLWCADGNRCSVPEGARGIDFMIGNNKIINDTNNKLKITTNNDTQIVINNNIVADIGRTNGGIIIRNESGDSTHFGHKPHIESVNCTGYNPKGSGAIYKYDGNNTIGWYPNPDVASTWDPNWASPKSIDCTGFNFNGQLGKNSTTPIYPNYIRGDIKFKDGLVVNGINVVERINTLYKRTSDLKWHIKNHKHKMYKPNNWDEMESDSSNRDGWQ